MSSHKKSNSKKPFMRKKCVNILLIFNNKRSSSFKETNITMMNVFVTSAFKALNLRLIIKSRQIIISSFLRLNESKPFERQRRESIIKSLLDLIQSNSSMPFDNQLSNSLNNISSSNFLIKKRPFVSKKRVYNQIFINENLALLKRSKSLYSFRSF